MMNHVFCGRSRLSERWATVSDATLQGFNAMAIALRRLCDHVCMLRYTKPESDRLCAALAIDISDRAEPSVSEAHQTAIRTLNRGDG